jgi:drug/metabolite transporter (DMT)-like permease
LVHIALATTQILFASLPIVAKFVFPTIGPPAVLFFRVAGSALAFGLILRMMAPERITDRRDLWSLAGLALIGVVLNQLLFLEGTRRTTAINTNVLITTIPVFTLAIAIMLGRERASPAKVAGIVLAGSGALYLVGIDRLSLDPDDSLGAGMLVGTTLCYSGYLVLSKPLLTRYRPLTVVTHVFLFGAVMVIPVGLVALWNTDVTAQPLVAIVGLAYIVVFTSIVTYFLSVWALRRTASSLVAMYVYVQPVVTAVASPMVLGERLTSRVVVAAVLIFAGLALASWGEQAAGQLGAAFRPPSEGG